MEKKKTGALVEFDSAVCLREWISEYNSLGSNGGSNVAPWHAEFLRAAEVTIPRAVLQYPWPEGGPPSVQVIGTWETPNVRRVVPICRIKLERDYADIVFVRDADSWLISVAARAVSFPDVGRQTEKRKYANCLLPSKYMRRPDTPRCGSEYTLHFRHRGLAITFFRELGKNLGVSRLSDEI